MILLQILKPPTFENTIEAMSFGGNVLERASSIFFNLHSAETNDEIQKIAHGGFSVIFRIW